VPALRCLPLGCRVRSEADFHEDVFRAVPVAAVTPEWMLSRGWDASDHVAESVKRLSDAVLALALLLLSLPLQLLVALAIRVQGDGPVFYVQTRVGRYGRPFRMLKFRTMRTDAEDGTARWAEDGDPRCTAVGRVLRRTRLDELPQLVNVLKGEMSIVGPRPEQIELVRRYRPEHRFRLAVKPGITGSMQVFGRGALTFPERLAVELDYVENLSLSRDLRILLQTLPAIVRGTGAY